MLELIKITISMKGFFDIFLFLLLITSNVENNKHTSGDEQNDEKILSFISSSPLNLHL